MKETIKTFEELSTAELYEIYRLRTAVFVVEQQCAYQEVDETDKRALHIWLSEEGEMRAYCRVFPLAPGEARVGRVIAVRRRQGLGSRVVGLAIKAAAEMLRAEKISVEAQSYAVPMYAKLGFEAVSDEFYEDGIPHIRMERPAT